MALLANRLALYNGLYTLAGESPFNVAILLYSSVLCYEYYIQFCSN